jgi:hypothetical protein
LKIGPLGVGLCRISDRAIPCRFMRCSPKAGRGAWFLCLVPLLALLPERAALSAPDDYLPVQDPLESELRILDLRDSAPLQGRIRLPHLGTRPLQMIELQGLGAPPDSLPASIGISVARLERALGRDRGPLFAPHPFYRSTPRVLEYGAGLQLLELSAGLEGRGDLGEHGSHFVSGTGLRARAAMELDRFEAFAHYVVGQVDHARQFADPIVPGNDLIVLPEETYLSYTQEMGRWGAQFGRERWHWGPGEEGSLVLSKTSPLLTGMAFHARLEALRADAIILSATLKPAAGEQLAAHRIEWQPRDGLRLGVTEAARYQAPTWRPLYLMGAVPYVLVQRLEVQSEPDSLRALRNNVLTAADAAWRLRDGLKVYGELLIDDVHARSASQPNKIAYQLGCEGVNDLAIGRFNWGAELTRLTRYVYTSFFGRDHALEGEPLGFPTGPDARRVRVRLGWDPDPDWGVSLVATHTDKGENSIDEPFLPGSPRIDSFQFEGVVERTREIELGARWWPASGVDLQVTAEWRSVSNAAHVPGRLDHGARLSLGARLVR